MKNTKNKILVASAVAIMMAPAALSALPQQSVSADAVGTLTTATPVYDTNGKTTGVTLPSGSQWKLGPQITLNGVAHYEVGTNEYVPASVVTNVNGSSNPVDTFGGKVANNFITTNSDAGKVGTANKVLDIVDNYGNSTGRTVPSGSQWKLGNVLHSNKQVYYQISTNEWISAMDVSVDGQSTGATNTVDTTNTINNYIETTENTGKVGTATAVLNIVDNQGQSTGQTLPSGSQWKLGQVLHSNKQTYYQVSTNAWVPAVDISVADQNTNNANTTTATTPGSYITTDTRAGQAGTANKTLDVVDSSGKSTGITLPKGSKWKVGNLLSADKETFYQIATNEWVLTTDLDFADNNTSNNTTAGDSYVTTSTDTGKIGTTISNLNVIDNNGNDTGKVLAKGSNWKLGNALHANNQIYYQVSTNEWVLASGMSINTKKTSTDAAIPTPGHGLVGTTNVASKTYNTATNSYDRTLPANSSWKISKLAVNKYGSYWGQVSSNEWVWISDVRLNSGLNLKTNSIYEPDFATNVKK